MKLTLSNVKEIKRNSNSPLTKRVCNYVIGRWSDYNDKNCLGDFSARIQICSSSPV